MGLGSEVSHDEIKQQFINLFSDFERRQEMNKKMLDIDLKHGFEEVWAIVKSKYREFKLS